MHGCMPTVMANLAPGLRVASGLRRLAGGARLVRCGGVWMLLWIVVVLSNLPWLAYHSPAFEYEAWEWRHDTTLTLGGIHALRLARQHRQRTVLLSGSSIIRYVPAGKLVSEATCVKAVTPSLELDTNLATARLLVDTAPADVMLVPLTWPYFYETVPTPQTKWDSGTWQRGRGERRLYQRYGFGHPYGVISLARRLVQHNWGWLQYRIKDRGRRQGRFWILTPIPVPEPDSPTAWACWIRQLVEDHPVASENQVRQMEALRQYGAAHGVEVLYFLMPHNPGYIDTLFSQEDFARFRASLEPHLFLDLADVLPREDFMDWHHVDATGGDTVAALLADALGTRPWPTPERMATVPSLSDRFRLAQAEFKTGYYMQTGNLPPGLWRLRMGVEHARSVGASAGHAAWRVARRTWNRCVIELLQYPTYIKVILGLER